MDKNIAGKFFFRNIFLLSHSPEVKNYDFRFIIYALERRLALVDGVLYHLNMIGLPRGENQTKSPGGYSDIFIHTSRDIRRLGSFLGFMQMKFSVAKCHSMRVTQHQHHKQILFDYSLLYTIKLWKMFSRQNTLVI